MMHRDMLEPVHKTSIKDSNHFGRSFRQCRRRAHDAEHQEATYLAWGAIVIIKEASGCRRVSSAARPRSTARVERWRLTSAVVGAWMMRSLTLMAKCSSKTVVRLASSGHFNFAKDIARSALSGMRRRCLIHLPRQKPADDISPMPSNAGFAAHSSISKWRLELKRGSTPPRWPMMK